MKVLTFFFALLALASGASASTHILIASEDSVYDYSLDPVASPALKFPSLDYKCVGRKGFNLNGSLVILGGNFTREVVKVVPDPTTAQQKEVIASMPHIHARYSAVQLDEFRVWFAGGFKKTYKFFKTGYVYDVRTHDFSQKDLPNAANGPVMVQISPDKTLVCVRPMDSPRPYCGRGCDIYNWSDGKWSETDSLPKCVMGAATGVITLPTPDCRKVVIAVGGHDVKDELMTTRLYDIKAGVWSTSNHSLPKTSAFGEGVVVDNTRFIVFGGYGTIGTNVYEFKHDSGWERLPVMTAPSFHNCAVIKYNYQ